MSTYQHTLPMVFSHVASVRRDDVEKLVSRLLTTDARYGSGSSFAVTVDGRDPREVSLWLSRASLTRLRATSDGHRLDARETVTGRE